MVPFWILISLFAFLLFGDICYDISFCNPGRLISQENAVYTNWIPNENKLQDTDFMSDSRVNRFPIPPRNVYDSLPAISNTRLGEGIRSLRSTCLTCSATHGSSHSGVGTARYDAYTSPTESQTMASIEVSRVTTISSIDFPFHTPTNTITPVQATIEVSFQVLSNTHSSDENEEHFGEIKEHKEESEEEENEDGDDDIVEIDSDDNEYRNCYECYEDQLVEENSEGTYCLWEKVDGESPEIELFVPGEDWSEDELVDWSEDELEGWSEDESEDLLDINPLMIPGSPPYEVLTPETRAGYLDDLEISVNRLISIINITEDDG